MTSQKVFDNSPLAAALKARNRPVPNYITREELKAFEDEFGEEGGRPVRRTGASRY
jgi:hypothetical protein